MADPKKSINYNRTLTADNLTKATKSVASGFNWIMSKLGEGLNTILTAGASTDFGLTSPFTNLDRKEVSKGRELIRLKANEKIAEGSVYISPSSHVAAWTQGSLNPMVGAEVLSRDPRLQTLGIIGDLATFKYAPKVVKKVPAVVDKGLASVGNKSAKGRIVAREIDKAVAGPIDLHQVSNQFIEQYVTNPKGSGKLIHFDKGDGKSVYRSQGASVRNGELHPGQTTREGQANYTWWNVDNPYMKVHKASNKKFSPSRYIITDDNGLFIHPFDAKGPVGQNAGKGRGFIVPEERVTSKPVDVTNAQVYTKSPFGWWENTKYIKESPTLTTYPWQLSNSTYSRFKLPNGKIRLQLNSHTEAKPRLIVLEPGGPNKYYVHMRMWDDVEKKVPANMSSAEKKLIFDALYNELPEGAEILFPKSGPDNYGTRGTVAGLMRLSRDPRFTPGTPGTLLYLDGNLVKTYKGTSFIKNGSEDVKDNVWVPENGRWIQVSYPSYINRVYNELKKKGIKTEPFDRSNTNQTTLTNFFTKGFNPVFKIYPQDNLKAHAQEILRRMRELGLDVDNTIGELPSYGKKSIKDLVTLNSGRISFVGHYNNSGTLGTFFHNNGTSIVDPGYPKENISPLQSIASTMHHERNMHGTLKFLTPKMWELYENFMAKMFPRIGLDPGGKIARISTKEGDIPIGKSSLNKTEFRATLGEIVKKIYETKAYNRAVVDHPTIKKSDIETIKPYFEKVVDNLTDEELLEYLENTNGYGVDYATVGPKNHPNFFSDLKTLLKIAPVSIPFILGGLNND